MRSSLTIALLFGGVICLILAEVTSIGVFIYQWGVVGLAIGAAAWAGFKVWATLFVIGVTSYLIGAGLS